MVNKFDIGSELLDLENQNNDTADSPLDCYFLDKEGYLCRYRSTKHGPIPARLANFQAFIKEEIIQDDGLEVKHSYAIEGKSCKGITLHRIEVSASQFNSMNWTYQWGNHAIIEPGQASKDFLRHAIQFCSNGIQQKTIFTHMGWRQINKEWVYLSNSGAIGADNICVRLPRGLQRYSLPQVPENELGAIKESLTFINIGNREITLPLFSLLYLAPLTTLLNPMPNFSGYLHGDTGTFKTTILELALSHFGPFGQGNLANFDDTANALGKQAFILKDTLSGLDDYFPSFRRVEAQQKEGLAQKIIRAYANRTGRSRLNPDASDKGRYEPRGMLLITGEELPVNQSTLARLMVIEISRGDISLQKLTEIQRNAHRLPSAMSSYIIWLKNQINAIKHSFPEKFLKLREKAQQQNVHKKLPEQVAFLQFALETAISWMVDKKVLHEKCADALAKEGWNIFISLSAKQSTRIEREDPVRKFLEIAQTIITQGKVKLEHKDERNHEILGQAMGDLIGYFDDAFLYLLPPAVWNSVMRFCSVEGSHFPISKNTFFRLLKNRGLIITTDNQTATPEWLRGRTRRVLKIYRSHIYEKEVMKVIGDEDA